MKLINTFLEFIKENNYKDTHILVIIYAQIIKDDEINKNKEEILCV